ncbi:hypothetical protein BDM02DRAFT_3266639 [Thelephora ganbajun]|uniref:Uncharacterized protein n=1 Tax=Thelephora ganbajun TaxID=370292 RepID=A0ACB6ZRP0_THEGA|nr:hypothetical protein BDM02DRAFT_3266639 [Thelephora ganbajun]
MSVHHRQPTLGRLMIPPNLGSQQPGQIAIFSPSLPTSIQQGFHPPFIGPIPGNVMTPIQTNFMPMPMPTAGRPINHRAHASIGQLAAVGIPPPMGVPLTPLLPGQFPQGIPPMLMPTPQFQLRSRRAPSVSTGGPPKAVLGGPGAKNRVITEIAPTPATTVPPQKTKKVVVNIPKETIPIEGGEETPGDEELPRREIWARIPLREPEVPEIIDPAPPEIISMESFPPEEWRTQLPSTVDVFLPGKATWDAYKKRIIDEKLARLGIDGVFGGGINVANTLPHIHAPHARAASISSPADPALLMFKLNKLHQSQNPSATNSVTTSPHPPVDHTPSPSQSHDTSKHGHSLSVDNPPAAPTYNPAAAFNPFGPQATLGSDQIFPRNLNMDRPPSKSPNSVGGPGSRPLSRPDFIRGFGLDIPEEEEPPEETDADNEEGADQGSDMDLVEAEADVEVETEDEGVAMLNRIHSRHVSRLSVALSLRSVGRQKDSLPDARSPVANVMVDDLDLIEKETDGVAEWTGSEDQRGESDEESIGEWSNPSDEERARQERRQRRVARRAQSTLQDVPRKLPNFPRPPPTSYLPLSNQREDDVLSNPSDEEKIIEERVYPQLPPSGSTGYGRPLPPLPHSRTTSTQFSYYDPAAAHSRTASEQVVSYPSLPTETATPLSAGLKPASLNPFAKPFVFGAKSTSTLPSWQQPTTVLTSAQSAQSIPSKPLNATASEFKPSFTFQPPIAAPHLSFNSQSPELTGRPLPTPPAVHDTNGREQQGREKRQRRSSDGDDDEGGINNMSSFKFPPTSSGDFGKGNHWSAPPTPAAFGVERRASVSAPPPQHFTVSGFVSDVPLHDSPDTENVEPKAEQSSYGHRALPVPPRQKRAPLPLDFTHPISKNTVPAGLFKALANGEADTSRRVRSRLPSRDVFDLSPPSLDDNHMPTISRTRLVTDPVNSANRDEPLGSSTPPPHRRRRSSLPASHGATHSSLSDFLGPSLATLGYSDLQQFEQRLDSLLDDKLDDLRRELMQQQNSSSLNETTETMLAELISLRGQLQESTSRTLESHKDFNYQWLQGVVQQASHETRSSLQRGLSEIMHRVEAQSHNTQDLQKELTPFINEVTSRTMKTIVSISQQYASRLESLADPASIVNEILNALTPHFTAIRPTPIDYDTLTSQLSQAVKPNISQLIDLASDKRETAGLILERLLPALQALAPVAPETNIDNLIGKVVAEVKKVVDQLDAHEIKEQVSDLVVERLDARLANQHRERMDSIAERIQEGVMSGVGSMPGEISSILDKLATIHREVSELNPEDFVSIRHDVVNTVADLPPKLDAAAESLNAALVDIKLQRETQSKWDDVAGKIDRTEYILHSLSDTQKTVSSQNLEILSAQKNAIAQVSTLSCALEEATQALKASQEELISRVQLSLKESEENMKLSAANSELQAQLAKARAAHGQVCVEKDAVSERFKAVEDERDSLKARLEELTGLLSIKSSKAAAAEARNFELEEAQNQALARQQATDATIQKLEARIAEYEKDTSQISSVKESLQAKVHELELYIAVATRDKAAAEQTAAAIREERDRLLSQQDHWEEMHRAAEQIQLLTSQVNEADNEELRHLKDYHDRTRPLEGEYNNLQRRFKDQETKLANLDRTMATVRQTLAQAQQRAVEWEKRAKEADIEISSIRGQLEETSSANTQLDSEVSLLKDQLQEKEADERLAKDRESKLRDQVAALEEQAARLEAEASKPPVVAPTAITPITNGYKFEQPIRSESRGSTVYLQSRSATPVNARPARAQLASNGVWNSMHNPYRATGAPHRLLDGNGLSTPKRNGVGIRPASPTASIASTAPTIDEDGWWS